jgi:hypothetical protein
MIRTGVAELTDGWGGEFFDSLATAAQILYTTVTSTVTDVVTGIEQAVETIVVTVVTGVVNAVTGLVDAFDAALQTVEQAADFVGALLAKAGAEIQSVIDFVKDLFDWDDILVAQEVLAKNIRETATIAKTFLTGAGTAAVEAIGRFQTSVDADFASWRAALTGGMPGEQAGKSRNSPPQDVRTTYLTSQMRAGLTGQDTDSTIDAYFGQALSTLMTDLTVPMEQLVASLPTAIDTSGFFDAFADPGSLLTTGLDLLLQGVQALTDLSLDAAQLLVEAITSLVEALIDGLMAMANAEIDIPLVTPFVEQVVFQGRAKLTMVDLLALGAAIPLTIAYKALSGDDSPAFTQADHDVFLQMDSSQYTWISNPFAASTPATDDADALAEPGFTPLSGRGVDGVKWGSGFVAAIAAGFWGVTATYSDFDFMGRAGVTGSSASIFGNPPEQVKFHQPLNIILLAAQGLYIVGTIPWKTDFNTTDDSIAFGLWASQLIPFVSNAISSGRNTTAWGKKGDPVVTGAYGVVSIAITAWLWRERTQRPDNDPVAVALEGFTNLFGALTWAPQLLKVSPVVQTLIALGVLDIVSYAMVIALTLGATGHDMAKTLGGGNQTAAAGPRAVPSLAPVTG